MRLPSRLKPGDKLTSGLLREIVRRTQMLAVRYVEPLQYDPRTNTVTLNGPDEFYALLTGAPTGASYPWREQIPAAGGSWSNGPRSGTAGVRPLIEINGSSLATPIRVRARRGPDGKYYFTLANC